MKYIGGIIFLALLSASWAADCEFSGHSVNVGESFQKTGECVSYHCDAKGSISAKTCAESHAPPSCKLIPQDNSKPYPECCKRYEC